MTKGKKLPAMPAGGAGFNNKLLVVGQEVEFSDLIIDYSLQMAARMKYSIVALNLLEVIHWKGLFSKSASGQARQEEFEERSVEGAKKFTRKAKKANIGFTHLFRVGNLDKVVRDIYKERGDIDLVLTEPEFLNIDQEDSLSIPAFSLVPSDD